LGIFLLFPAVGYLVRVYDFGFSYAIFSAFLMLYLIIISFIFRKILSKDLAMKRSKIG
jgi:hypothetical protein